MPHIHEKIDFTATVYIVHKDKVLLRKHEKYHIWLGVGGHIELDEDPNQAAIREAKEEVGLDIKLIDSNPSPFLTDYSDKGGDYRQLIAPLFMNIHKINDVHRHIDLVYAGTSESDRVIPEKEGEEWLWLTESEVEENKEIAETIRHYSLTALKLASGK